MYRIEKNRNGKTWVLVSDRPGIIKQYFVTRAEALRFLRSTTRRRGSDLDNSSRKAAP